MEVQITDVKPFANLGTSTPRSRINTRELKEQVQERIAAIDQLKTALDLEVKLNNRVKIFGQDLIEK